MDALIIWLKEEIKAIDQDPRIPPNREPASIQVNAPLALEQTANEARRAALKQVLKLTGPFTDEEKACLSQFWSSHRMSPEYLKANFSRQTLTSLLEGGVIECQEDITHRHFGDFYLTEAGREFIRQNKL